MNGQQYPALMLARMVALGDDEKFADGATMHC
jgi:hypothetical protein